MRCLVSLFFLATASYGQTTQTWTWKNPLPQGNTLHMVTLLPGGDIMAGGEGGMLMRSTDEGVSWTMTSHPAGMRIVRGGTFPTDLVGYLCGEDGSGAGLVAKTTDGGLHWIPQETNTFSPLLNVTFLDASKGFVCGLGGTLLRTTDGGSSWTAVPTETFDDVNDVGFRSALLGTAVLENGAILATDDGGETWTPLSKVTNQTIRRIRYNAQGTAVAVGDSGLVLIRNEEGGMDLITPATDERLTDVVWLSVANVVGVGPSGVVVTSLTGGGTWQAVAGGSSAQILAASATPSGKIIAVGHDGEVTVSADAGQAWAALREGPLSTVHALACTDDGAVFAVGAGGTSYSRDAHTASWTLHEQQFSSTMYTAVSLSDSIGVSAGSGGRVYRSTDGGKSWTELTSGTTNTLYGAATRDETTLIVGNNGTILRSTDLGQTWAPQTSGTTSSLRAVGFSAPSTAFAVGTNATLLRSTDAGATWSADQLPVATMYVSVSFSDSLHGLVGGAPLGAGLPPNLLATTDGGASWQTRQVKAPQSTNPFAFFTINTLAFRDPATWLAGSIEGAMFSSVDSGHTWSQLLTGTSREVRSLAWAHDRWIAVGASGMILESPRDTTVVTVSEHPEPHIPVSPILLRAFPNPFNPTTTIAFTSAMVGDARVQVYDMVGRLVVTLFDGRVEPGQSIRLTFDGGGIASGTYIVRATMGPHAGVDRILLIR